MSKRTQRVMAKVDARHAKRRLSEDEIERRTRLLESVEGQCTPYCLRIVAYTWGLTTGTEQTQMETALAFGLNVSAVAQHLYRVKRQLKEAASNGR